MAGDNVGLLLRGTEKEEVERGQVVAKPGSITPHTKFKAEAYVLTKEEGGRHTPFFTGYRPQFYFRTTDVTGDVKLPEGVEMVMPGDNVVGGDFADYAGGDGEGVALRDSRRRPHRWRRRRHRDHRVNLCHQRRKNSNSPESLRSPHSGSVHAGDRGDRQAHRRRCGRADSAAHDHQPLDGVAVAARGQEIARAV